MTAPWYATREDVKAALDSKETARNNGQIDRALEAASRSIEGLCHRRFYPELDTRYWDWPNAQTAAPWRLWLDDSELISVTTLSSGGTTIPPSSFNLEPNRSGPPYSSIEIKISTSAAFGGGPTYQRDITVTGLWGYANTETAAGDLAEALDTTETAVDVTNSAAVGVGSIIRVGTERMIVTEKSMLTTGQTLQAPLGAGKNEETLAVTSGPAYFLGETLLLDAERMLIIDIAANNLIVKRAWDGSTLAAHTGSTIYAPRTLTVVRGALGTTAAAASIGDDVLRWDPPGPVRQLCIAEALSELLQERAGWFRTVSSSGGSSREVTLGALVDLREQVYTSHGRKARSRAV